MATGYYRLDDLGRRAARRSAQGALRHARRRGRHHRPGVPGHDPGLRPLPRPQGRPDLPEGLLQLPGLLRGHQRRGAGARGQPHRDHDAGRAGPLPGCARRAEAGAGATRGRARGGRPGVRARGRGRSAPRRAAQRPRGRVVPALPRLLAGAARVRLPLTLRFGFSEAAAPRLRRARQGGGTRPGPRGRAGRPRGRRLHLRPRRGGRGATPGGPRGRRRSRRRQRHCGSGARHGRPAPGTHTAPSRDVHAGRPGGGALVVPRRAGLALQLRGSRPGLDGAGLRRLRVGRGARGLRDSGDARRRGSHPLGRFGHLAAAVLRLGRGVARRADPGRTSRPRGRDLPERGRGRPGVG